ncbi:MAG: DNA polymerase I [Alphaproteobacteria bacterium]|nr:DNA polymerase I [Alphaproteobacteria bacterium]
MTEKNKNHLYLVDGSGYIFRAFHALPPLTRPDGTPINAVLGFTNMLIKLILDMKADHIAVVFDSSRKTFRNEIYSEYKANREETPIELIPQFSLVREACKAFNVAMVEMPGFEADDLIATYAEIAVAQDMDVTILSSDKDLMQLVTEKIVMFDPIRNRDIGIAEVFEKFGVTPNKVIDVQALAGDSSDNVPGVPGIGIKTAAELIQTYGDLENLLAHAHEIKQPKRREKLQENAHNARLSYQLVTLKKDVPVEESIASFVFTEPHEVELLAFLNEQKFTAVKARLEKRGFKLGGELPDAPVHKSGHYELIQDMPALQRWIQKIVDCGYVVFDTETTGLDPMSVDLVGISLSVEEGSACYIPLGHRARKKDLFDFDHKADDMVQIPMNEALTALKPLLENAAIIKIGQNIKYDMLVMRRYGVEISPIEDTMVMSYVLDGTTHGHGMDELARLFLDYQTIPFSDVAGKGKSQLTFDEVPLEAACKYAAEDADITGRLYNFLKTRLVKESQSTVYETLDKPMISVLAQMEATGIGVNVQKLKAMSADFSARLALLEKEIYHMAGREFNIASPKQLADILFEEMGLDVGKKSSKTGAFSTGADILEDLAAQGHALPSVILDWRHLAKLKSTYTDALPLQINRKTGRIHTSFGMTVTSTGRLSSNNPNLQNIPVHSEEGVKIRGAFEAAAGHKLLSLDYSQIELRLLAHMADIPQLQYAFHHNYDIHKITASEVFGVPIEQVDSEMRSRAKVINFGIIYGMSAHGLSRQLRIPRSDAAKFINVYLERYPGIKTYMEAQKQTAHEYGYVKTLFGRKCFLPEINDKNPSRRGFAERAAINAPLQGTVSDLIKKAMIQVHAALSLENLDAKMLLQIHDELIFEVPDHQLEATISVVKPLMESAVSLKVPIVVDSGIGQTWADT